MAHTEDCSTVLEQFVHDVANLPAEITHLMEEIQAKDKIMQECRMTINSRDNSLQKFIKQHGSHVPNPKEDSYSRTILQNLDRSQVLQDDKIQLSEKACMLLDRQIKKLDIKIRELQNDGVLSKDPPIPSLFRNKDQFREPQKPILPEQAPAETSYASPLNPTSGNSALQYNLPHRANNTITGRSASSAAALAASQTNVRNSAPATPASAILHLQQRRESSAGAVDNKRRRLNTSLGNVPAASSNLRQSSLGPGTPKPGTPVASRAGSVGPRATTVAKKPPPKKVAPHQQQARRKTATVGKPTKRSSSGNGRLKVITANIAAAAASRKKSPSSTTGLVEEEEEESVLSSAEVSESENNLPASKRNAGARGAGAGESEGEADEEEDEGGEDTKTYCTCRSVSHGDMVACDNDECPYEWFHWKCVGLTREPLGTWYCDECRKNLGK
ncbi:uncharacterized protein PADG_04377 [Paracoccidioides brasiliensis Pb18]|uniref:Chromatin modification-related protein n=2 Tax=Paracoccidioides brasiliensis TaxID=121759 RepID=C1GAU1_PARBD|nr:uncharacterized protein PADG_04377 [Paracoccidioides brasiliensis Pb18]EEH48293.1 hypothetical protein PADG_04377 [Paracoccidioides brasiliensis Pb18]ODH13054.1 hypothetical protein ACO22_07648 [Paracoccidioides brasiliensis]ODH52395.1 hypothetical protein GX48_01458 [Paracoccidioides brasiliensis]